MCCVGSKGVVLRLLLEAGSRFVLGVVLGVFRSRETLRAAEPPVIASFRGLSLAGW